MCEFTLLAGWDIPFADSRTSWTPKHQQVRCVLSGNLEKLSKGSTLKEKCHLHQLSSGVKFIQTWLWHRITFSHHTMHTKGSDSRRSDKDLQTPSVFIFSVLVGDQKTTPPPVSTLCALSEPPRHFGFLYHWVGWLGSNQWGVPPLQEQGLSPPKGQWCCPEASGPRLSSRQSTSNVRNCTMHFFMSEIWRFWLGQTLKAGSTNMVTMNHRCCTKVRVGANALTWVKFS